MCEYPRPRLQKIPGIMPPAQPESRKKDLGQHTRLELLEMKERQAHLLANKSKLNRLPDKGKRIQDFYVKVSAELLRRDSVDEAAAMFSKLNIPATGQKALEQMEWHGRANEKDLLAAIDQPEEGLDSDDEMELNPLRILAQRTMHERRVKVLPPTPSLITAADLDEIASFKIGSPDAGVSVQNSPAYMDKDASIVDISVSAKLEQLEPRLKQIVENDKQPENVKNKGDLEGDLPLDPHVHYLVEKTESMALQHREKFKPYQTTKTNVHDPAKERARILGKRWEVTAATPPLIQNNCAQTVTLLDSVGLQTNYLAKLNMLQEQQASERLAAKMERLELRKLQLPAEWEDLKTKSSFTTYREKAANQIEGEQQINEDDEVLDTVDEERASGVVYTVYD